MDGDTFLSAAACRWLSCPLRAFWEGKPRCWFAISCSTANWQLVHARAPRLARLSSHDGSSHFGSLASLASEILGTTEQQ